MSLSILHIIGSLVGGGAETQLKLLIQGLARDGWHTGVVFLRDDPGFTERSGIEFFPIERGSKFDLLGLSRRIAQAIDSFQPDIVHTWLPEIMTIPATLHARQRGIPSLSSQRRSLRHPLSFRSRLRDTLIPFNHLLANRVVCNFSYEQEPRFTRYIIERRQAEVIRNGFQPPITSPAEKSPGLRDEAFKILYVGRLVEQKRVDLLLRAVAARRRENSDLQLAIYGGGQQKAALCALAESEGLQIGRDVLFMGYRPDWHQHAVHFDLFVLPSLAEGMPNVLIEAMGLGLPALSTNIFEISSIIRHGQDAWLVKPGSEQALADGLLKLQTDSSLRTSLRDHGLQLAHRLNPEHMVRAYQKLYLDMV